ncbi:hypothetical protein PM8797T_21558 [Gimesia maris DSM 8797]|nr:hypothetical protein PM8797T_21558 [Gimesia maris DSM 8797]
MNYLNSVGAADLVNKIVLLLILLVLSSENTRFLKKYREFFHSTQTFNLTL